MKRYTFITKIALSILAFCFFVGPLHADNVPISTISQVATNAFSYYSSVPSVEVTVKNIIPIKTNDTVLLYVCNFEKGFVLVSADDVAHPILGFSDEDTFDINDMAPAVEFVINNYKEEILYAKRTRLTTSLDIQNEWQSYVNNNFDRGFYTPTTYLIQTQWNQKGGNLNSSTIGFNYYCPIHTQSGSSCKTVVGCGAVALAQILHYWACDVYPHGTVYNSYEDEYLNLSDQSYQWYDMLSRKANTHNARLLADCAIAINSEFGCRSTGSQIHKIRSTLVNNYGFGQSVMLTKSNFSNNVWTDTLKSNLNNRCPILYYGTNNSTPPGGHGWVIDGYNNDYFHCNFGWGGNNDGWFILTDITLGSHNYNNNQGAILNIYPTHYTNNVSFINTLIYTGTYTGHKITICNSNMWKGANVVLDAECSTEIYGPFSVPVGFTLEIR